MEPLQTLERNYESFISREQPFAFFRGLAEYLGYAIDTQLKGVFEEQIAERDALYSRIQSFENKALAEVRKAKDKLLKSIEKNKLDVSQFKYFGFSIPPFKNPVEELEAYEKGHIGRSGYKSDHIEHYLFEIAANLKALDRKDLLKDWLVSESEYQRYHARARTGAIYLVMGNQHGNFIFSKSWPERHQLEALIEKERKLKPWGAFEALLQFKRAYDEVSKNGGFDTILQTNVETPREVYDAVQTAFMAEDLKFYMGDGTDTYRSRLLNSEGKTGHLEKDVFKTHAQTVHNRLMRASAANAPSARSDATPSFDPAKSRFFVKDKTIAIRKLSDQYHLLRVIFENPDEVAQEWFFSEIAERIDPYKPGEKRYYNAAYQVRSKLEKGGIPDFFTTTRQSVQISPKYLS